MLVHILVTVYYKNRYQFSSTYCLHHGIHKTHSFLYVKIFLNLICDSLSSKYETFSENNSALEEPE